MLLGQSCTVTTITQIIQTFQVFLFFSIYGNQKNCKALSLILKVKLQISVSPLACCCVGPSQFSWVFRSVYILSGALNIVDCQTHEGFDLDLWAAFAIVAVTWLGVHIMAHLIYIFQSRHRHKLTTHILFSFMFYSGSSVGKCRLLSQLGKWYLQHQNYLKANDKSREEESLNSDVIDIDCAYHMANEL